MMTTIWLTFLLCLVALVLDSGTAAPISDQEEAEQQRNARRFDGLQQFKKSRAQQADFPEQFVQQLQEYDNLDEYLQNLQQDQNNAQLVQSLRQVPSGEQLFQQLRQVQNKEQFDRVVKKVPITYLSQLVTLLREDESNEAETEKFTAEQQLSNAQRFADTPVSDQKGAEQWSNGKWADKQKLAGAEQRGNAQIFLGDIIRQLAEMEQFTDAKQFTNTRQFANRQQSRGSKRQLADYLEQFLGQAMNRGQGKENNARDQRRG